MKEIQLTQGQVALVDDDDYEYLNQWKWYARKQGRGYYAGRSSSRVDGKQRNIHMHRVILGLTDPKSLCDHKDGNGLNNQRINIRVANYSDNCCNRFSTGFSKYLGVYYAPRNKRKWVASVRRDGVTTHLGCFNTEIEAAFAYNNEAKKVHNNFARLNSI